jgi:amino-acid N-acetyltransferase
MESVMTHEWSTAPMQDADRASVAGLLAAAALPSLPSDAPIEHFFVVRSGGRVVAAVGLDVHGDAALLRSLVVAPDMRRRGLGSALVERVLARARRLDVAAVWLLTTTAAGLFRKFGFVETARADAPPHIAATSEFRDVCPAGATCMREDPRATARCAAPTRDDAARAFDALSPALARRRSPRRPS